MGAMTPSRVLPPLKKILPPLKKDGRQLNKIYILCSYTWKPHIDVAAEKGAKRSRLFKRLTATKWGATQDVLSMAYKTYVRPVMEYGSEVMVTASNCQLAKLDKIQNAALRTITGGAKSTPIAAMELQAGVEPLASRRDKATLKFWERMKRTGATFWRQYIPARGRLKTQTAPLARLAELQTKYNINLAEPDEAPQLTPVFKHLPTAVLQLDDHSSHKSQSLDIELRKAALQTIHIRYPAPTWLHIYTDGSSIPGTGNTGAGYFCALFEGHAAVGAPASCFDGEIAAISNAADKLLQVTSYNHAAFLIDSQAAILALSSNRTTDCQRTIDCRAKLDGLASSGWNIALQWIPSHVGVAGNEKADALAKQGTTLLQPSLKMTLTSAKQHISSSIKLQVNQNYRAVAAGKKWEELTIKPMDQQLPRQVAVATFRMLTGHDYLAAHLCRIGVLQSEECPLCNSGTMDADHLLACPALSDDRDNAPTEHLLSNLYWSARRQMAEMPHAGVG